MANVIPAALLDNWMPICLSHNFNVITMLLLSINYSCQSRWCEKSKCMPVSTRNWKLNVKMNRTRISSHYKFASAVMIGFILTLYNVCSVWCSVQWGHVQYIRGILWIYRGIPWVHVHQRMFSTSEGYHEYIRGILWVHQADIMSTSGGYHEYIGGCSEHRRDIMIYIGDIMSTAREYHDSCGGANGWKPFINIGNRNVLMATPTWIMISPHKSCSPTFIMISLRRTEHPRWIYDIPLHKSW